MSTHKRLTLIAVISICVAVLITVALLIFHEDVPDAQLGYEDKLFDSSYVHEIDLQVDDWDSFIGSCENEEYVLASVTVDGEDFPAVGLRAKGNTSLSSVSQMGSDRYSFKLEFDQYNSGSSYYGLDKLCLNNLIQDNTYMKDYLAYTLMNEFGVNSPLCSYVNITVNGEPWGLYLAVESVEEGFLRRNYGDDYGELYKPDSLSFGGGRGNGKNFDFDEWQSENSASDEEDSSSSQTEKEAGPQFSFGNGEPPADFSQMMGGGNAMPADFPDMEQFGEQFAEQFGKQFGEDISEKFGGFGGMSGMGSEDVKLQYIDNSADSYSNIFNSSKTGASAADKNRLIRSLQKLSSYEDLEQVLDIDQLLRYFVVHNFLVNDDSYTGNMIHNYYLYEKDGVMAMIPWDYNLSFGGFAGGSASSAVNDPIDQVLDDRPMQAWIFSSEEYTQQYHEYYAQFLGSVDLQALISETAAMIRPYVEQDVTAFCTIDEFDTAIETLQQFVSLRCQSISGQLEGSIPSTSAEQQSGSSTLVNAGDLNLSDMGSMGGGGMPSGMGNSAFSFGRAAGSQIQDQTAPEPADSTDAHPQQEAAAMPARGEMPQGQTDVAAMPERSEMPQQGNAPDMSGDDQTRFQGDGAPVSDGNIPQFDGSSAVAPDQSSEGSASENSFAEGFDPGSEGFTPPDSSLGDGRPSDKTAPEANAETVWLLIACGVLLLAAILLAWRWPRRGK